jgi:hypothetical protein
MPGKQTTQRGAVVRRHTITTGRGKDRRDLHVNVIRKVS